MWIQFAQSLLTVAHQPRAGCIRLVQTENVCHHITKTDHPPREMKETILNRNNQTVLPLLANYKKDTQQ